VQKDLKKLPTMPTKYIRTERPKNDVPEDFWFYSVPLDEISLKGSWPANVDFTLALLIEFDFRPELFNKILDRCKSINLMMCKNEGDGCDLEIYGKKGLIISTQFQPQREGWKFDDLKNFGFAGDNEIMVWKR
jgi:hypothetical protein